jgi:hypothetical protein
MIEGVMPKSHQYLNRFSGVLMSLLVEGLLLFNEIFLLRAGNAGAATGVFHLSIVWAGFTIGIQMWFQRRIVCEFDYDGRALQFRTLGIRQTQVRPLEDLAKVKDWSGRGGPIGYLFRGGGKVYLYYSVANSITLANQLRRDAKG